MRQGGVYISEVTRHLTIAARRMQATCSARDSGDSFTPRTETPLFLKDSSLGSPQPTAVSIYLIVLSIRLSVYLVPYNKALIKSLLYFYIKAYINKRKKFYYTII